tara:strand:- start:406 stop:738 length:333 start_codon:yes stop_codon:yes gene_type:complete
MTKETKMTDTEFLLNECPDNVRDDWKNIINLVGEDNIHVNWEWYEMTKNHVNEKTGNSIPKVRGWITDCVWNCMCWISYGEMFDDDKQTDEHNKGIVKSVLYHVGNMKIS